MSYKLQVNIQKAAFYVRLSKEDENKVNHDDNSESIKNQINLLSDYAGRNNIEIEGIYIDDDYSGLYEERPGFERLIANAKAHKFNMILCKTQSRFTRNMQHSEKYLEELFPTLGIRFIGIVDGVDTGAHENKKARQINGLVNDWYVEDLSNNIRAVFNRKMKEGQNLAAFPAFGYLKDPTDKHKLIIDAEAANIVKIIYDLSLQGFGVSRIADKLTEEKIPTPVQYKRMQGMNYATPNSKYTQMGLWSTTTIKRILNNEIYLGWLIQGREKKISYKSKKIITTPREEWIIVKNHHEPIISEENFYKVQMLMKTRRKSCKRKNSQYMVSIDHTDQMIDHTRGVPHLFAGKIICKDCKSVMTKTSGRLAKGHDYFWCQLAKKSKLVDCTRHSIRYDYLEKYVTEEIHKIINTCLENKENMEEIKSHININHDRIRQIEKNSDLLIQNSKEIKDNEKAISNLYLDKVKGIISEMEYIKLKLTFQHNIQNLTDKNEIYTQKNNEYKEEFENKKNLDTIVKKYGDFQKLTYEIVNDFISFIEIGEVQDDVAQGNEKMVEKKDVKKQKNRIQEIIIHWNI